MGLEGREEHAGNTARSGFGGVRTFPLIGLIGYAMATLLAGGERAVQWRPAWWPSLPFSPSSYWHKLALWRTTRSHVGDVGGC